MREMLGEGSFNKEWEYIKITGNFLREILQIIFIKEHIFVIGKSFAKIVAYGKKKNMHKSEHGNICIHV